MSQKIKAAMERERIKRNRATQEITMNTVMEEKEVLERKQRKIAIEMQEKAMPKDTPKEIKEYARRFKELYIERGNEAFTPHLASDLLAEVLKEYGFKKEPKKKGSKRRKSSTGKTYLPKEFSDYQEIALSSYRFLERTMEEGFEREEGKEILKFKRVRGNYIEECRFDKDVIEYGGKKHIPNIASMRRDLIAKGVLYMEKKQNPYSFTMKENMMARGYTEEELKDVSGVYYQKALRDFIQLAAFRYMRWIKKPDGTKKLVCIENSPYQKIRLPERKGDPYTVHLRGELIKSLDPNTFRLTPGRFKTLPIANPYQGQFVEERTFNFLEKDVRGRSLKIKAETFLRDKLGIQEQDLHRKGGRSIEYLDRALTVVKNEGYLFEIDNTYRDRNGEMKKTGKKGVIDFLKKRTLEEIKVFFKSELKDKKIQDESLFGDCRKWKFTFHSPKKSKHKLTDGDILLALKITKWLHDPRNDFRIENPKELTEVQVKSYIQLLGSEAVERAYIEAKEENSLFEKTEDGQRINQGTQFWNYLKEIKLNQS